MLDRRFKNKLRVKQEFYLFRRKPSLIFYVRFLSGKTLSTGKTNISEAYATALIKLKQNPSSKTEFSKVLQNYYQKNSLYQKYDIQHGIQLSDRDRVKAHYRIQKIASFLNDVKTFEALTRSRLIRLQDSLLESGLSAKTVNNYMSDFHRIIKQLYDKDIIQSNNFIKIKTVVGAKLQRSCFDVKKVKGIWTNEKYSLLAYIAICTGARRGEFFNWTLKGNLLLIKGTKTVNARRIVPLSDNAVKKLHLLEKEKITERDYRKAVEWVGQRTGESTKGIVFHSYRKMFKTILTSANINQSVIETLIGHAQNNQQSNSVERIYFVEEKADLKNIYEKVTQAMDFYLE